MCLNCVGLYVNIDAKQGTFKTRKSELNFNHTLDEYSTLIYLTIKHLNLILKINKTIHDIDIINKIILKIYIYCGYIVMQFKNT